MESKMSVRRKAKKYLVGVAFTGGLVLSSALSQAVTVNFDTYLSGLNVGTGSIATLDANQDGANVLMTLTNTFSEAASFDTQLFLTYLGSSLGIGLADVSGVATAGFTNPAPATFVNAGYTWDMVAEWGTSNAGGGVLRLNPGESSTFLLTNALLSSLFAGSLISPFAMLHLQGLTPVDGDDSSKYGGTIVSNPVPLPGSILLLFSALGGLGFLARARKAGATA
jgi:hypothetical protein